MRGPRMSSRVGRLRPAVTQVTDEWLPTWGYQLQVTEPGLQADSLYFLPRFVNFITIYHCMDSGASASIDAL